MPSYKSYCWSLGTTSFRMVEFNRKIETQLRLLSNFWNEAKNIGEKWSANSAIQTAYYEYIKSCGFIEDKEAPRKDKDARQKTSGLVDLGLVTDERRLTEVGQTLLQIAESGKFETNNLLQIPADSFVYFKQLLKLSCEFEGQYVRPYVVLAYMLCELQELSKDEFTYLLPLAINYDKTLCLVEKIKDIRNGKENIDDVICNLLSELDNYKEALSIFLSASDITENLILDIGMNRKSGKYDLAYFGLYQALVDYKNKPDNISTSNLLRAVKRISGKAQTYWKQYIFNTSLSSKIEKEGQSTVNNMALFVVVSEEEFRKEFFFKLHLFKAKSLLDDYYDLNKRYFKTSDTVLFQDNKVRFDIIPKCYFESIKGNLLNFAFTKDSNLVLDCSLDEIGNGLNVTEQTMIHSVEKTYGVETKNLYDIKSFVENERYQRFNQMIDTLFTDDVIINLMSLFENRQDDEIRALVTNNADVPTIFEYILAIAWYKISNREGKVLDYMNLSLDADLLPITHAAGGHEDITFKYEKTEHYPKHTLLIEATLANSTNQRRMEMEPVSRHLGDYLLSHPEENAYCLFSTTFLHINVVADFRGRQNMAYYSSDGERAINGMKIIPCQTSEIKKILENHIKYSQLYELFEHAFHSTIAPNKWYEEEIKCKLMN